MHIYKKSVLFFIIAVLVSGTFAVAPQKAHAQFGVIVIDDLFFNVKEALDSVAWGVAKSIIGQMQGSILQWASTGFDGNPVFIQDPALYLQNIGKSTANGFIEAIGPAIDPSMRTPVQQALAYKYDQNIEGRLKCPSVGSESFLDGNFSDGGFDQYFVTSQNMPCTVYGTYVEASIEGDNQIKNAQAKELELLNQGQGFLPTRNAEGDITTPGSVTNEQINDILKSPTRQLEAADEIEEFIASFINNLVSRLLQEGLNQLGGL